MIKLSVIVPIYNVEPYLAQCLASIFAQDIEDMEVIAIVDGSPDNSIEIAREFAAQHPNMKVIEQENRGLSATRNRGIREARGEYICWIDSDDYYTPHALEEVYRLCIDNDLDFIATAFHQFPYEVEKMKPTDGSLSPVMDGREFIRYVVEHDYRFAWPSNYIHKRSFLLANELFFLEGCVFEGLPYAIKSATVATRCMYYNAPLTQYRIRMDSLSHDKKTPKVVHDLFRTLVVLVDTCESAKLPSEYIPYFAKTIRKRVYLGANAWAELTAEECAECKAMCTPRELLYSQAFVMPVFFQNRKIKSHTKAIEKLNKQAKRLRKTVSEQQDKIEAFTASAQKGKKTWRHKLGILRNKLLR